jgi:hypothetical protein
LNTKVAQIINTTTGNVVSRVLFPTGGATATPQSPFSGNNFRSVVPVSTNTFYAAGTSSGTTNTGGAWFYNGTSFTQVSSTATGQPTNLRVVEIYNNQLYATSAASTGYGIWAIGSGLPTTAGNDSTLLFNSSNSVTGTPSPYGFVMFDTNNDNTLDLAYIADDRTTAGGGLQKWTFNGSTWTNSWSLFVGGVLSSDTRYKLQSSTGVGWSGLRGLAGKYDATTGTTTLYATTTELSDNRIISISDTGSTLPSTYTELASAGPSYYAFRGVDLIGSSISAPTVTTPTATSITATGATLGGNVTADGGATITERGVVYAATATNNDPLIGGTGVTNVTAAGTTGVFTAPVSGLTQGTGYSYKAYAINSQGTTYTSVGTFTTLSIYEQWASTNNVSPTLMTDDDDTDGVPNLLEFAFGTNPQSGSSGPQQLAYSGTFAGGGSITGRGHPDVAFESVTTGVDYRALFVRRKDHAAAGLSYRVEFSRNLTTWQPTSVSPTVLADDGVYQVVSVPYISFIQGRKVKFFRVQVELAP